VCTKNTLQPPKRGNLYPGLNGARNMESWFCLMNDLKELLFQEAKKAEDSYYFARTIDSGWDNTLIKLWARWQTLLNLIRDSGLNEEYRAWENTQNDKTRR
ncbi:MAG: hypothetical protein IJL59_02990, partial [Clostridia bacterium]|nr:hypothetical protein [Clostridia bacterium]